MPPKRTAADMTTAVLRTSVAVAVVALGVVLLGAIAGGAPAAYGALAGGLLVLAVLGTGSLVVDVVAKVMPAASLMVALLTYTLQVVLMAAVFVALSRSGLLDDALDRQWLGGAIIAGTLAWTFVQVWLTAHLRIPAYDVPTGDAGRESEPGAR
jgi:hypothetical protein